MFIKAFFIQALWNYERLQNIGFLFILKPFLCRAYSDESRRKEAFLRHTGFFNTHPYMVNLVVAVVANMEKKIAGNNFSEKIPDINIIKSTMEGPLAAIGDSFFWGTLRYFVAFISVLMTVLFVSAFNSQYASYSFLVPLAFIFLYNIVHISLRYWLMLVGFKFDKVKNIVAVLNFKLKFLLKILRYSEVIIVIVALVLYMRYLSSMFFGNDVYGVFAYVALFVLSIFASWRFGAVFLFCFTILLCIVISCLGI
jgi:PTS system mannose-specific IID component